MYRISRIPNAVFRYFFNKLIYSNSLNIDNQLVMPDISQ